MSDGMDGAQIDQQACHEMRTPNNKTGLVFSCTYVSIT
jgi:hypothetical protein